MTAVRVLIALGAAGAIIWAFIAFAAGAVFLSLSKAVPDDATDSDVTAGAGMSMSGAGALEIVLGVVLLVLAVVDLRVSGGLAHPGPRGRRHLTWHIGIDAAVFLPLGVAVFGPEFLLLVVLGLPGTALVLGLLWVPDSSRRWFGDDKPFSWLGRPASMVGPPRPAPARSPRSGPSWSGPPSPPAGLRPSTTPPTRSNPWVLDGPTAAIRRTPRPGPSGVDAATVAVPPRSCAACARPVERAWAHCGHCGSRLAPGAPEPRA